MAFIQEDDIVEEQLSYSCVLFGPKEALYDGEFLYHTAYSFLNSKKFKPISGILTLNINGENQIILTFMAFNYNLAFDVCNLYILFITSFSLFPLGIFQTLMSKYKLPIRHSSSEVWMLLKNNVI